LPPNKISVIGVYIDKGAQAMRSDNELAEAVLEGDGKAFEELMNRYKQLVFRQCLKLVQSAEAAEELALDVFINFHKAISRIDLEAGAGPYLLKSARNICYNWQRKRKREPNAVSINRAAGQVKEKGPGGALHLEMLELLSHLSDEKRTALELFFLQGYKYREIAEMQDVPIGTVKSRINSGLKELRERFAEGGQGGA
jgi:RNA polymerase sigma-70 factor (ECF subfamily)